MTSYFIAIDFIECVIASLIKKIIIYDCALILLMKKKHIQYTNDHLFIV